MRACRRRDGNLAASPWAVGLLGLVLGLAAGWIQRVTVRPVEPPPGASAAPPGSGTVVPPPSAEELRSRLATLRRELEADARIRAALDLVEGQRPEVVTETWEQGRTAFRTFAPRLAALLRELDGFPVDGESVSEAARIFVVQELLTRTRRSDVGPLLDTGEVPDPGRLVRRGARLDPVPELDGWREGTTPEQWHSEELRVLEAEGGRWETVRTWSSMRRGTPQGDLYDDSLKPRNPQGAGFVDPGHGLSGAVAVTFAGTFGQKRSYVDSPLSILVSTRDVPGDLELVFTIRDWDASYLLVAEVEARDGSLFLAWGRPGSRPEVVAGKDEPRLGARMVVDAAILPRGGRKVRFSCWGLQPIGAPREAVRLSEVFQKIE